MYPYHRWTASNAYERVACSHFVCVSPPGAPGREVDHLHLHLHFSEGAPSTVGNQAGSISMKDPKSLGFFDTAITAPSACPRVSAWPPPSIATKKHSSSPTSSCPTSSRRRPLCTPLGFYSHLTDSPRAALLCASTLCAPSSTSTSGRQSGRCTRWRRSRPRSTVR